MKLNDEQKFKLLCVCSGDFLCKQYPADWHDLSPQTQYIFVEQNAWDLVSNYDPDRIIGFINDSFSSHLTFIEGINHAQSATINTMP